MLSVFSVLAALLSCGNLIRQSAVDSIRSSPATREIPTGAVTTETKSSTIPRWNLIVSLHFGDRWLYTLESHTVAVSRCLLVFEGPANFHCSPLNDTHAEVSFLPIVAGNLSAKIVLHNREIKISGVGLPNPFRPSGLNFELPPDVTFEPWLYLHNPLSTPVRLKEVYVTNPTFAVEVPLGTTWTIPAHTTRPVARVSIGHERRYDISYLRVRSVDDVVSLYLPLRLLPANLVDPTPIGLFYPERNLNIGPFFVTSAPQTVPLNVVNTSPKAVVLRGSNGGDALRLVTSEKPIGPGKTCTVKVTVEPQRLTQKSGKLLLRGGKLKLQVPYTIQLLNGSLQASNSRFYIGAKGKRAFSIEVKNQVNAGLRIERVLVDSTRVHVWTPVVAKDDSTDIHLPTPNNSSRSFNSTMRVFTNVTEFVYQLEFYSGKLDLRIDNKLITDRVDLGILGVKQKKRLTLDFYNANPLQMQVEYFASNLSSALIALPRPPPWIIVPYGSLQVMLTVSSPSEGQIWGNIMTKTDFETQSWLFGFQATKGTVTATGMSSSPMISVEGAFPFGNSAELVYLESTFDEPLLVTRVRVNDERFSMDLVDSPVLHPGAKSLLGTLKYRPVCTQCYVGLGGPLETSSTRDLFLWREMQERLKEARVVNATLLVDTKQMRGFVVPVMVNHVWPRVTARGAVRFDTIRLGNVSYNPVVVDNPSDQPLMIQAYISTTGGSEINALVGAQHSIKLPPPLSTAFSIDPSLQYSLSLIPPKTKKRILVRFEPTTIGNHFGVLVVRNNLTAVSSVILKGEGGVSKLLLAGQEPGGTIVFDINTSLLKDCGSIGVYSTLKKYPVAKNVGHLPIRVRRVLINEKACVGYGFRVRECDPEIPFGFIIKPNASHRIEMSFTPDFTVSRVEVTLSLVLDDSLMEFNLIVTLPKSSMSMCVEEMARPSWEGVLYTLCLIGSLLLVLCVISFAFLDSNRVLRETLYEPRSRWERREISTFAKVIQFMMNCISRTLPDFEQGERTDHRASVATQTGMEEAEHEQKILAHKESRGPSTSRRKDSGPSGANFSGSGLGATSMRKDARRRKKDSSFDPFGDRALQPLATEASSFDETLSEIGDIEENVADKASEPEDREGVSVSLTVEVEAAKETDDSRLDDATEDVGLEADSASEVGSEFSAEAPSSLAAENTEVESEKVKTKSQRKAERRERQKKQSQASPNSTISASPNDAKTSSTKLSSEDSQVNQRKSSADATMSQAEKRERNRKPEVRECPSRMKKQQKQLLLQQQAAATTRPSTTAFAVNKNSANKASPASAASTTKATQSTATDANDASTNSQGSSSNKTAKNNAKNSATSIGLVGAGVISTSGSILKNHSQSSIATITTTTAAANSLKVSSTTNSTVHSKSAKTTNVASSHSSKPTATTAASSTGHNKTKSSTSAPDSSASFRSAFSWSNFGSSDGSAVDSGSTKGGNADESKSTTILPFPTAWTKPIYSFSNAVITSAASRVTSTLTSGLSSESRCLPAQDVHGFRGAATMTTNSTVSSAHASDVESESNSPKPEEQQDYDEEYALKSDGKLYIEDQDTTIAMIESNDGVPTKKTGKISARSSVATNPTGGNSLPSSKFARNELKEELTAYKIENSAANRKNNNNNNNNINNSAETSDVSRSNSSAGHSSASNISCRSIASSSPSSDVIMGSSDVTKAGVSSHSNVGNDSGQTSNNNYNNSFGSSGSLAANAIMNSLNNRNLILNNISTCLSGSDTPNSCLSSSHNTSNSPVNNVTDSNNSNIMNNNIAIPNSGQAGSDYGNPSYNDNSLCNSINSILNNLNNSSSSSSSSNNNNKIAGAVIDNNMHNNASNFGSNSFLNNAYNKSNSLINTPMISSFGNNAIGGANANPQQHSTQQTARSVGTVNILTDLSVSGSGGKLNPDCNNAAAVKSSGSGKTNNNLNNNIDKNNKQTQEPSKVSIISDICNSNPTSMTTTNIKTNSNKVGNLCASIPGGSAIATTTATTTANVSYSAVVSGGIINTSAGLAEKNINSGSSSSSSNHNNSLILNNDNSQSNVSVNNKSSNLNISELGANNGQYGGAVRRGNPPPGFGLRPYAASAASSSANYMSGFGSLSGDTSFGRLNALQAAASTTIASSAPSSTSSSAAATPTNSAGLSKINAIGTDQSEEQEMAPLIRSIIDSVIPSSDRDDRSSVHWTSSESSQGSTASGNASRGSSSPAPSVQVWGAESSWMNSSTGSSAAVIGAPPSQMYPTFLRRTPERESERDRRELGLDLHQRMAWNQQQHQHPPTPQQQQQSQQLQQPQPIPPHHQLHPSAQLNAPTMSPTNDYSYTGTDIWTTTQSGSAEPPMFPSPIGTPWTPFRSPSLSLSSLKGAGGIDRVVKKKNQ